MNICLEKDFLRKLECHFLDTKPKDLREYLAEIICKAIGHLNSVRSGFTVRDVHFDIHECCRTIRIEIDQYWPKCQDAYLEVQPEIVKTFIRESRKDLVSVLGFMDKCQKRPSHNFSLGTIIHELGHLLDAQTKDFHYKKEVKDNELSQSFGIVWNVLLERKLRSYCVPNIYKDEETAWSSFWDELVLLGMEREKKKQEVTDFFRSLWEEGDCRHYNYDQIIGRAVELLTVMKGD